MRNETDFVERTSTMAPRTPKFDLAFRPDYWNPADPLTAIVGNIKGQLRREMVTDIVTGQAKQMTDSPEIAGALSEVEPGLLQDELTDHLFLERVDPRWMGGEYLPAYQPGELEIARIVLNSTTMDVIALRARRGRAGRIRYRVVDEYAPADWSSYGFRPRSSAVPLSFGELIALLDGLEYAGQPYLEALRGQNLEWGASPEDSAAFFHVSSPFYPHLRAYYEWRGSQWAAAKRAEMEQGAE